jgi:DNA repair protein RecO (recombination protein O)
MNAAADQAFVLHTLPWRETSLIIEVFTRDHGRLGLIARGARRPRSVLRGLLQPFQPLALRWSGKSELRNLIAAEWVGGMPSLSGVELMSGFYLNELMVRLIPREDPHATLFDDYQETLGMMAQMQQDHAREITEPLLRRFECNLLREMGYAPVFDRESHQGQAVHANGWYQVSAQAGISRIAHHADHGAQSAASPDADVCFHGKTLLALASAGGSIAQAVSALEDPEIAAESKRLLRALLGHHLGQDGLQSRQVMRDLVQL